MAKVPEDQRPLNHLTEAQASMDGWPPISIAAAAKVDSPQKRRPLQRRSRAHDDIVRLGEPGELTGSYDVIGDLIVAVGEPIEGDRVGSHPLGRWPRPAVGLDRDATVDMTQDQPRSRGQTWDVEVLQPWLFTIEAQ